MDKRYQISLVLLLCFVTAGVYARAALFPFNLLDDVAYVTQNAHVMQGLSLHTVKWAFTSVYQYNWIPLTWISFALDAHFFGADPMGYHVVNVVFHVVNVYLLFFLLNKMTGAFWKSLLVAALFGLHPLRVESVAWITERKDVLSTMFWMLTLISYFFYTQKKGAAMYILSLFAFTLGLLSKQMLLTVPAVLLLIDFWPLGRLRVHGAQRVTDQQGSEYQDTRRVLIEKIPFVLLSATATAIAFYSNYVSKSLKSMELIPLSQRVGNSLWYFIEYLSKTFFPLKLAIVYPTLKEPYWKAAGAAILIGLILFIAFKRLGKSPYLATGFLFYLATVFPVIGLVQVGTVSIADRFVYVPLIGILIMISWGADDIVKNWPHLRHAVYGVIGIAVGGSIAMTCVQLSYWKDNTSLFLHAVDVTKENHVAHEMLGLSYAEEGKSDLALDEFNKAMKIGPECPVLHLFMGNLLDKEGRAQEAAKHYEVVTRLSPNKASGHIYYARMLHKMGRMKEAIAEYHRAIDLEPENALFHYYLGLAHLQVEQLDDSIEHFSAAVTLDPSSQQASANLEFAKSLKNHHK